MSLRQFFPAVPVELLGPDPDAIVPRYAAPYKVHFKSGMDTSQFVEAMKGEARVTVTAAACAGKSVRMPADIVRGGRRLLVHVVPNLNTAKGLWNYVSAIHKDIKVTFVDDFVDGGFPDAGLVITSSSVFCAYAAAWRGRGEDPGLALYVDECHESDCATYVLRELKNGVPGVEVYIEASATAGAEPTVAGFGKVVTPATTRTFEYADVPAADWNMFESGKPWNVGKITGDFLVFTDDVDEANTLVDKFRAAGITPYLVTSRTSLGDYEIIMKAVNNKPMSAPACAVIQDSAYRSAGTYPTVTRIIDTCRVAYYQWDGSRAIRTYRRANASEVYQANARGARVPDKPCDYWRPRYTPDNNMVALEGIEADAAALIFRMLGYVPPPIFRGTPFYKGSVPRLFTTCMGGKTAMRLYKREFVWPKPVPDVVAPVLEPALVSPPDSPRDREGSVYTVDSDGQSRGYAAGVEGAAGSPVTTPGGESERRDTTVFRGFPPPKTRPEEAFKRAFSKYRDDKADYVFGQYYSIPDLAVAAPSGRFASFEDVTRAAGRLGLRDFIMGLPSDTREEVVGISLQLYNASVAMHNAAHHVVDVANTNVELEAAVGRNAVYVWLQEVHGYFMRAQAQGGLALEVLAAGAPGRQRVMPVMGQVEQESVKTLLSLLRDDRAAGGTVHGSVVPVGHFAGVGSADGAYRLDIRPNSLRSRIALSIMGGDAVVDVVFNAVN